MLYAVFGVLAIVLDQWTKYWAGTNLVEGADAIEFISGLVSLENVHNKGAAFSFLSDTEFAGTLFVILALVFAVLVVIGIATNFIAGKLARWAATFVAAGGIGNAIDRLMYGYVQDMIKFDFVDFPVFNVADIFITVFCLVFILCILFGGKAPKEETDDDYYGESEEDSAEAVPARRSRGSRRNAEPDDYEEESYSSRAGRARSRIEADFEEDDYDESVVSARSRRSAEQQNREAKRERRSNYGDEFEQYQANRNARVSDSDGVSGRNSSVDDPFAAWDKANSAAGYDSRPASESENTAGRQATVKPASQGPSRQASWSSDELSEFFGQSSSRQSGSSGNSQPSKQARSTQSSGTGARSSVPVSEVSVRPSRITAQSTEDASVRSSRSSYSRQASSEAPVRQARTVEESAAPSTQSKITSSDDFNLDDILAEFK